MTTLIAIVIAKVLDPITLGMALMAGTLSRAWWQIAVAAIAVPVVGELIFAMTQEGHSFSVPVFGVAIVAAFVWAALAFGIKRWRASRRAAQPRRAGSKLPVWRRYSRVVHNDDQ